ncbi:ribonuclease H-like domain-containing protein [Tanacetum coccineum]
MGYLARAYYSISPTRYYKDDSCWSADLKSKATKDIISIGNFMEVLVLNHYVLVRKIFSYAGTRLANNARAQGSDGELFQAEEMVALQLEMTKQVIEGDCANPTKDKVDEEELKFFMLILLKWIRGPCLILFCYVLVANYLSIKSLLDLTCQTVDDMIKGMTLRRSVRRSTSRTI